METGYTNSVRKVRNALHFKGGFNMELAKVTSKGQSYFINKMLSERKGD